MLAVLWGSLPESHRGQEGNPLCWGRGNSHSLAVHHRTGGCCLLPVVLEPTRISPTLLFQTYMLHDSLEHAQLFDLMRRMLEFDPSQRITFSEALLHPFFAGLSAEERMLCGRSASRDLSR